MPNASRNHKSLAGLRIYQTSQQVEDKVYELVKSLPTKEFYPLGNDLRRSSAAISHYVAESHKRYSYAIKLETLHLARTEAEELRNLLKEYSQRGYGQTDALQEDCTAIIKQAWGLIRYLKQRQTEEQTSAHTRASDEIVAARS